MRTHEDLTKLADLVVEVFEVGTRKAERDVADEVCSKFGIDLESLEQRLGMTQSAASTAKIRKQLRSDVARSLAERAKTSEALMLAVVDSGASFLKMLDEIYRFLSGFRATTQGTSEEFTFKLGDEDLGITLSPAFFETVRRLQEAIVQVESGTIDDEKLSAFLCTDGDFYGSWPVTDRVAFRTPSGRNIARDATYLAWLEGELQTLSHPGSRWTPAQRAFEQVSVAMQEFVASALFLVRAHVAGLDRDEPSEAGKDHGELEDCRHRAFLLQKRLFREFAYLRGGVYPSKVCAILTPESSWLNVSVTPLLRGPHCLGTSPNCLVGMRNGLFPDFPGTPIGGLACLCGLWKAGCKRSPDESSDLRAILQRDDAEGLVSWLDDLRQMLGDASKWLRTDVWHGTGVTEETHIVEVAEQLLNLPLWRHRWLLYEIWLVCTTIGSATCHGWRCNPSLEFNPSKRIHTWVLPKGRAASPCAALTLPSAAQAKLEVWYQSEHKRGTTQMRPDVCIRTPEPLPQDLVIVEGKDRFRMPSVSKQEGALSVGHKYRSASMAPVTWLVNYCKFASAELQDARKNHGDDWRRLHFASQMRPGSVPPLFTQTIGAALLPVHLRGVPKNEDGSEALVFVVDTTGSMHDKMKTIWAWMAELSKDQQRQRVFSEFWVVLFGDHEQGSHEPYVVRSLGPFTDLGQLIASAQDQALTGGGDSPEALEDAMLSCRELAGKLGRSSCLVIVTDAPPHAREECPEHIDFLNEVNGLLDLGCTLMVVKDWLTADAVSSWDPVQGNSRFHWIELGGGIDFRELLASTRK